MPLANSISLASPAFVASATPEVSYTDTVFVNETTGNDATAAANDPNLPYLTLNSALAGSMEGWTIVLQTTVTSITYYQTPYGSRVITGSDITDYILLDGGDLEGPHIYFDGVAVSQILMGSNITLGTTAAHLHGTNGAVVAVINGFGQNGNGGIEGGSGSPAIGADGDDGAPESSQAGLPGESVSSYGQDASAGGEPGTVGYSVKIYGTLEVTAANLYGGNGGAGAAGGVGGYCQGGAGGDGGSAMSGTDDWGGDGGAGGNATSVGGNGSNGGAGGNGGSIYRMDAGTVVVSSTLTGGSGGVGGAGGSYDIVSAGAGGLGGAGAGSGSSGVNGADGSGSQVAGNPGVDGDAGVDGSVVDAF